MKRFLMMFVMVLVAVGLSLFTGTDASARPQYKSRFDDATKDTKAAELIKGHKCNVCHYVTDKKKRNDFGQAVNKHIDKATFDKLKGEKEKLDKKIEEAIQAAMKEKSPEGKTFGELIKEGKLPAKIVEK